MEKSYNPAAIKFHFVALAHKLYLAYEYLRMQSSVGKLLQLNNELHSAPGMAPKSVSLFNPLHNTIKQSQDQCPHLTLPVYDVQRGALVPGLLFKGHDCGLALSSV